MSMERQILQEMKVIEKYLKKEGIDRPFYEGKLEALDWVLRRLPSEG